MSDSFSTLWAVAYQAPLSMGFPRQKYWSQLAFSSPGDLLDPGLEPGPPTMQADSYHWVTSEAHKYVFACVYIDRHKTRTHIPRPEKWEAMQDQEKVCGAKVRRGRILEVMEFFIYLKCEICIKYQFFFVSCDSSIVNNLAFFGWSCLREFEEAKCCRNKTAVT